MERVGSVPADGGLKELEEKLDNLQEGGGAAGGAGGADNKDAGGEGEGGKKKKEKIVFVKPPKVQLTKAERRAQQEAQRAAKAGGEGGQAPAGGGGGGGGAPAKDAGAAKVPAQPDSGEKKGGGTAAPGGRLQYDDPKAVERAKRNQVLQRTEGQKKVPWFSHLPQYEREASLSSQLSQRKNNEIHPEVLKLGLKFADWLIVGGNARTIAMLQAFIHVVRDYSPLDADSGADMSYHLEPRLKPMISYLVSCRPLSIGMGNAVRWLKGKIAHLRDSSQSSQEAKDYICDQIETYITEKIVFADRIIAKHGASKLKDGDVVLTYARSTAVEQAIIHAHTEGKKIKVIVVDSRPKLEGKELLRSLTNRGISCTYVLISALSYVMAEVTKVMLGASAMLSNGNVVSRVGTASVALMANQCKVPVLVCCETYKFSEKVMLDSICNNELGDPDEISKSSKSLSEWRDVKDMKLLNLVYDLTPIDLITLVVTELGHLPPTSVPVVIREYRKEVTL